MNLSFKNKILGISIACSLMLVLAVLVFYHPEWFHPVTLKNLVSQAGIWAPALFIGIFIMCTLFFVPALPLCLISGLVFGLWWGTFYSLLGLAMGSSCAFLFARYCGADWLNRKAGPKLHATLKGVGESGWQLVAILRLLPLVPFTILNYAFGLTPLRLSHFAFASFVFSTPAYFTYAYLGHIGMQISLGKIPVLQTSMLGISMLATLLLLPHCFKKFKTQLLEIKSPRSK